LKKRTVKQKKKFSRGGGGKEKGRKVRGREKGGKEKGGK